MSERYKFKGWDWTELAEYFGIGVNEYHFDKACQPLIDFLEGFNYLGDDYNSSKAEGEAKEIIDACRAYLKKLSKHNIGYLSPLWTGLNQVEHDGEFMNYFIQLLPGMWT